MSVNTRGAKRPQGSISFELTCDINDSDECDA